MQSKTYLIVICMLPSADSFHLVAFQHRSLYPQLQHQYSITFVTEGALHKYYKKSINSVYTKRNDD